MKKSLKYLERIISYNIIDVEDFASIICMGDEEEWKVMCIGRINFGVLHKYAKKGFHFEYETTGQNMTAIRGGLTIIMEVRYA